MAIFSKIDGANICPGLNGEELKASFNQALVCLLNMQRDEGLKGFFPPSGQISHSGRAVSNMPVTEN